MSRTSVFIFISLIAFAGLFSSFNLTAQQQPWTYCGNTCHPSLTQAENAMRADTSDPANPYLQPSSSFVDGDGAVSIIYLAPDQSAILAPVRYSHGLGTQNKPCGSDWCSDEGTIVSFLETELARDNDPAICMAGSFRTVGSYSSPYKEIAVTPKYEGVISYSNDRRLEYQYTCASGISETRFVYLFKLQNFSCQAGFRAKKFDREPELARWADKKYCTAIQGSALISGRAMQLSACPANANPCYPATGDKARFEDDFEFSGRKFSRSYHSLRQLLAPNMARGWSHSFQESISTGGSDKIRYINEKGYVELFTFSSSSSTVATGSISGRVIQRDPKNFAAGWKVFDESGDIREFDYSGRLVAINSGYDSAGSIRFSYDGTSRKLLSAKDQTGRELLFDYTSDLLTGIYLPDGREVQYAYANGDLVEASVAGSSRKYSYASNSLLIGIKDEAGSDYAKFTYDDRERVTSSKLLIGQSGEVEVTTLNYIGDTSVEVSVDGKGAQKYTVDSGLSRRITAIANERGIYQKKYDSRDSLKSSIDRNGNETEYYYNNGILTDYREYMGNYTSGNRRSVSIYRDEVGRSTGGQIAGLENNVQKINLLYRKIYDKSGKLASECRVDPLISTANSYTCGTQAISPTGIRQVRYERCLQAGYDAGACPFIGALLSIQKDNGTQQIATRLSYYNANGSGCDSSSGQCPYRKGDLWKVTNPLGQVIEYLSYDGAGRVLSMKGANGIITDYTYHPRGWLTASKVRGSDDTSEGDDRITRIDYWPTGLVKQVTQPDGAFTAFTYDTAHRLTDITDNAGNTLHYTLNSAGNRVKEDTRDAAGTLKRTLSRVYNQLGQLSTQATAKGDPTDFSYDANGNATKVTDALGHVTQNDYDPLNRLARTLQDVGGISAETKLAYDALDNLTKVTDPKGLDTTYAYNGLGDLTKLTSPDTGVTTYTYDSAGNRATQTDARDINTAYSYDALNRLTKVTYPTSSLNVTYTYDISQSACASGETYTVGRLARMQDGSGTTDYCYDRFGDLVRKVQTTNGKVFVLRYAYTKAGQLSRLTYPDGAAVDYVRNAQGQTTEVGVTPAGGTRQVLLGNATYYPFGPVASWSYGNGRPMQRVLDQDYRPLAVSDTRSDGLSTGFAFDPAGNLSALTAAGNTAPVVSLDYDALGRLTAFKDGPTGTVIDGYSYDATGNRLSAKVNTITQSYTYPTTNHRLSAVAGTARTYDAIGNTLSIGGVAQEFAYDATGRMSQAKRAGTVVMKYGYNGRGEQVRRVDKTNTYTLYDESGHWLGNYDANGASLQQAIWLDDLPVGVLAKNSLRYVQPDHLGSPRAVIDPARDVAIWTWDLKGEAFGNTPPDQDPDKDGTAFVFDMRFPGQRYDSATGLNQNYFRDYDPGTGRYGQSDPIGLDGGISAYGYVGGSPISYVDPLGLLRFHPWVHQKYPDTVAYLNAIKDRMTQRKYDGFARFGNIGRGHLDHLLDPCSGPVVTPEKMKHDNGSYIPGGGEILVHRVYFDRYEAGDRSPELLNILNTTVEHELVHFTEYFWNGNKSRVEEGWYYENYVYGTKIPNFN